MNVQIVFREKERMETFLAAFNPQVTNLEFDSDNPLFFSCSIDVERIDTLAYVYKFNHSEIKGKNQVNRDA